MSIGFKHLLYAEVAKRRGSFREAADTLSLKQANLSRRVRALEDQLGIRLFARTDGGVRTTAAGRDFIRGARRILEDLQAHVDSANAVERGDAGHLTISF
jgi:DNA-binding transcriptional LysR family regulator